MNMNPITPDDMNTLVGQLVPMASADPEIDSAQRVALTFLQGLAGQLRLSFLEDKNRILSSSDSIVRCSDTAMELRLKFRPEGKFFSRRLTFRVDGRQFNKVIVNDTFVISADVAASQAKAWIEAARFL